MIRRYMEHPIDIDGWTEWIEPDQKLYRIRCCDCRLVHDLQFRIDDGKVQFRARRNIRRTAASRRKR